MTPETPLPIESDSIADLLRRKLGRFGTASLPASSIQALREHIETNIGTIDSKSESYAAEDIPWQRDLSMKYHWGHTHDFGTFTVKGRMGWRHVNILAGFLSYFNLDEGYFNGKDILDVGCWTGGTSLLLAALGSTVVAVEEVRKYAVTAAFLVELFGLAEQVRVEPISLYDCSSAQFQESFDIVYCPGVLYHLTDPVLGLRILFNSLRVGGCLLLESAGLNSEEPLCLFSGSLQHGAGTQEALNRGGWSWFTPSISALERMLAEVGFSEVECKWGAKRNNIYCYAHKKRRAGICRAGLSRRDVP